MSICLSISEEFIKQYYTKTSKNIEHKRTLSCVTNGLKCRCIYKERTPMDNAIIFKPIWWASIKRIKTFQMILLVVPLNLWRPVVVLDIPILKSLFLLLKIHTYIWDHKLVGFLPFDLWDFLKMEFSSSLLIPNFFDQPRRFPFPTSSTCSSFSSRASNYHSNFEK